LFAHFGVALQGVEDVQLMESATRRTTRSRKYLNSLTKCVEQNVFLPFGGSNLASWKLAKEKGEQLFKAEHGGSFEIFNRRSIPEEIIAYCVGDVQHLPELRHKFWNSQTHQWRDLINEESKKRIAASQKPEYQPHGPNRTVAPWSEDQNRTLDQWNYVPPRRDYFDDDFGSHGGWSDQDWDDDMAGNDFEDWTRAPWQGPPS
jgi:exonuclease 3'-5' domain-containing protein 1